MHGAPCATANVIVTLRHARRTPRIEITCSVHCVLACTCACACACARARVCCAFSAAARSYSSHLVRSAFLVPARARRDRRPMGSTFKIRESLRPLGVSTPSVCASSARSGQPVPASGVGTAFPPCCCCGCCTRVGTSTRPRASSPLLYLREAAPTTAPLRPQQYSGLRVREHLPCAAGVGTETGTGVDLPQHCGAGWRTPGCLVGTVGR